MVSGVSRLSLDNKVKHQNPFGVKLDGSIVPIKSPSMTGCAHRPFCPDNPMSKVSPVDRPYGQCEGFLWSRGTVRPDNSRSVPPGSSLWVLLALDGSPRSDVFQTSSGRRIGVLNRQFTVNERTPNSRV